MTVTKAPWIALGTTAVLASVSNLQLPISFPLGSQTIGTSTPLPVASPYVPPPLTGGVGSVASKVDGLTIATDSGVEWTLTDPLKMAYPSISMQESNAKTHHVLQLEGSLKVRNTKSDQDVRITFELDPTAIDSARLNSRNKEKPLELKVTPSETKLAKNDFGHKRVNLEIRNIPNECQFLTASFKGFVLLERPHDCVRREGYILAQVDLTTYQSNQPDKKSAVSRVIRWKSSFPTSNELQYQIITGSAFWAMGIVAIALVFSWLKGHPPWKSMKGTINWDFLKSWASNTTLFGVLFSSVMSMTSFPTQTLLLTKGAYAFISLWAILLLALGPQIYNAVIWTDKNGVQKHFAFVFLVGQFFVLWAALAQLRAVRALVAELALERIVPISLESSISVTIGLIFVFLCIYTIVSLVNVISTPTLAPQPVESAPQSLALL
jgi:hypothetical protein